MPTDFVQLFSSLGLGAFIGAALSRAADILQERRRQQFELRKRLFELKTDATLRVIKSAKYGTQTLKSVATHIEDLFEPIAKGTSTPAYEEKFKSEAERAVESLQRLVDEEPGAEALLAFFYGENVTALTRRQDDFARAVRAKLVKLLQQVEGDLRSVTDAQPKSPEEAKALLTKIVRILAALREGLRELKSDADALDKGSDNLIGELRREFQPFSG